MNTHNAAAWRNAFYISIVEFTGRIMIAVFTALLLLASLACAANWEPYEELAYPERWDSPTPGRAAMFAGTDPGGKNIDSGNFVRVEPECASFQEADWVLAEVEGPGCITRIWVTGKDKNNQGPRIFGRIQIFVDSKDAPVIDLPIEEFFGKSSPFSPPLATPTSGGFISYVPIPFNSYCKVVVTDHRDRFAHRTNGLGQTIPHLYHQICWRKLPSDVEVEAFSLPLSAKRKRLLEMAAEKMLPKPVSLDVKTSEYASGQKREVFSAEGSGRIEEIDVVCGDSENLWISMYWDGNASPAVEASARMFFAGGPAPQRFSSLPFSSDGTTFTCRFPMAFEDSARIYLENRGDKPLKAGCSVSTSPNGDSDMRFCARYFDTQVESHTPDMQILRVENGSGKFVGAALSLPHDFLEGNESFWVDGEDPEWVGTGTEDYFSGGWYFCFGPYDHAFSGCTSKGQDTGFVSAYRFHLLDAVPFDRSLVMGLEHGGNNEKAGPAKGVAYWYKRKE